MNNLKTLLHQLSLFKGDIVPLTKQAEALGLTASEFAIAAKYERDAVPADLVEKVCSAYEMSLDEYETAFDLATGVTPIWNEPCQTWTKFGELLRAIVREHSVSIQDISKAVSIPIPYLNRLCVHEQKTPPGLVDKLLGIYFPEQLSLTSMKQRLSAIQPVSVLGRTLFQRLLVWFIRENISSFSEPMFRELSPLADIQREEIFDSNKVPVYQYFCECYTRLTGKKNVRATLFEEIEITDWQLKLLRNGQAGFPQEPLEAVKVRFADDELGRVCWDILNEISAPTMSIFPSIRFATKEQVGFCMAIMEALPYMDDKTALATIYDLWEVRRIKAEKRKGAKFRYASHGDIPRTPFIQYLWSTPCIRNLSRGAFSKQIGINYIHYSRWASGEQEVSSQHLQTILNEFALTDIEKALAIYFADLSRRIIVVDSYQMTIEQRVLARELNRSLHCLSSEEVLGIINTLRAANPTSKPKGKK